MFKTAQDGLKEAMVEAGRLVKKILHWLRRVQDGDLDQDGGSRDGESGQYELTGLADGWNVSGKGEGQNDFHVSGF